MNNDNSKIDILDYILIVFKWKKLFIILGVISFIVAYLMVYFLISPKYDSSALIIPSQQENLGDLSSILRSMKGFSNLPFGLNNVAQNTSNDIDKYKTIIYSRTNLDSIIYKFGLMEDYGLKSLEKTEKELKGNIDANETKEDAFVIKVRASSKEKAAKMVNYIVGRLNQTMINLNVRKSRDNRIFLGDRYNEIKNNLKKAEDSLKLFQERSGVLEAEDQVKATIEGYAKMEAELAAKQVQLLVFKKLFGESAPQFRNQQIEVEEYKKKLEELQTSGQKNALLLPLSSLPEKATNYYRYYRNVKIYNSMLEFIVPLYEQAKFDEQKEIPILQIIDYGVPPEKRSYPPRILFAFIITCAVLLLVYLFLLISEILQNSGNPKVALIKKELRFFKLKKSSNIRAD
jgi:capsule polysaccharide export protein KpsE/RkpR